MECKKLAEIIHQLFLLFSLFTQFFEKFFQHHRTFLAQKSFFCLHLMIESFFIQKIQYRTGAAGFRVHGTDVNFWNPRLHNRPCAHRARFQRHVQLAFFQAPVAHALARFFDCRDLRMCQRAMIDHPAVVPLPMILSSYTITQPIGTSPSAQAFFASRIAAFIYFSSRVNFAATVFPLSCFISLSILPRKTALCQESLRKIG